MLNFILRRFALMFLTMLVVSMAVFYLVNLEPNLRKLAKEQGSSRQTDAEVVSWLEKNGYYRPFHVRYSEWLFNALQGDLGHSTRFNEPVNSFIFEKLSHTGILAFWVLVVMVPTALLVGIFSGMREGSKLDRGLSIFSIVSTGTPEYVSGIVFTVIFSSWLGLLKGVAKAGDVTLLNFTLPVMTMSLYGMGYIARITRASMLEVMSSQYIRTARLKGLSFRYIVFKHALRNALVTPFTVIMLQFPWLLTGVVIVERLFNYKGFGWVLVESAETNDINLLLACSLVSVFVVVITQLISDIAYVYLNPRIRVG